MATRRFHFRAFISLFMLLSVLIIVVGGVVLYLAPPGRVANWTEWRLLGLTKSQWQGLHTVFAFLFAIGAGIHVYLNWRVIRSYLFDRARRVVRRKWELVTASSAAVLVLVLTLAGVPPFSTILDLGERASYAWAVPEAEPPIPHAERLHLEGYAAAVGLTPGEVDDRLAVAGLGPWDPALNLEELAATHGLSPRALNERIGGRTTPFGLMGGGRGAIQLEDGAPPGTGVGAGAGAGGWGTGYGRLTIESFCAAEAIQVTEALARLQDAGITARPGDRIRTVATESGTEPAELARIMRGG
jgi:hypothetical protein